MDNINIVFFILLGICHALSLYFMIIQATLQCKQPDISGTKLITDDSVHWKIADYTSESMIILYQWIVFFMLFIEVYLYRLLMNAMKAGLHKFYITKRESIYSLLKISLIWMSSFLIMHLIGSFAIGNFNDVAYLDSQKDSNSAEVYASMLLIFCSNIPLNFYAIMTVKNIDFKLYICYIFLIKSN